MSNPYGSAILSINTISSLKVTPVAVAAALKDISEGNIATGIAQGLQAGVSVAEAVRGVSLGGATLVANIGSLIANANRARVELATEGGIRRETALTSRWTRFHWQPVLQQERLLARQLQLL